MKLITVQNYKVVQELAERGVFESYINMALAYDKNLKYAHEHLAKCVNEKVGTDIQNPVFGVSKLKLNGRKVSLDKTGVLKLALEYTDMLFDFINIDIFNTFNLVLELDVPDDYVLHINQLEFNNYLTKSSQTIECEIDDMYKINKDTPVITSVLPHIKKEWIKSVYKIILLGETNNSKAVALCGFKSINNLNKMELKHSFKIEDGYISEFKMPKGEVNYLEQLKDDEKGVEDWLFKKDFDEELFKEGIMRIYGFPKEVVDMFDLPSDKENIDYEILDIFYSKVMSVIEMIEEDTMID